MPKTNQPHSFRAFDERPFYSKAWLAKYGQTLNRDEIRLVQAYRGLSPTDQQGLSILASRLVIERATDSTESPNLRRAHAK
jgi:hypothetical protein